MSFSKKLFIFIIFIYLLELINYSQDAITGGNSSKKGGGTTGTTTTTSLLKVSDPEFLPDGGIFDSPITVTINSKTEGATIRYTTNGSDPTENSSLYSYPIPVNNGMTIKARAYKTGFTPSNVITRSFTIKETCASPTFSLTEGVYYTEITVSLSTLTSSAKIYYTLDGSEPSTSSLLYDSPINITKTTTIKAITIKEGYNDSSVSTITYTLKVKSPFSLLPEGLYKNEQDVTLDCETEGATIYYTTDDTTPDINSNIYTTPIHLDTNTTNLIKAIAVKDNWENSDILTLSYVITGKVTSPQFLPPEGTYITPQEVVISCLTPDSIIRYTTNGSEPDETSTEYTGPISVSSSMTIKAKAFKTNWDDSDTTTATYIITGTCAAPTFEPESGIYNEIQNVSINVSSPSGVTIYYTLDGTDPVPGSSLIYTTPITINRNTTIKAIATKDGWANSIISQANFVLKPKDPNFNLDSGIFTTPQDIVLSTETTGAEIRYTTDDSTPDYSSPLYTSPIHIDYDTTLTIKAIAIKENWSDSNVITKTYIVTGKVATPTFSHTEGEYPESIDVTISTSTSGATIRYTTDGSEPTISSPVYSGPINIPLFTTMTIKAKAFKTNWDDSNTNSATYVVNGPVATPTILPASGTYDQTTMISMSTTTTGATIRYTVDGSEPTSSSTLYTSPFELTTSCTIKARAFKTNWTDSNVASNDYILYRYYLYVPNNGSNNISMFRINDDGTLTNIGTKSGLAGNGPRSIAVHPSGNYIFVTENTGNKVESFSVEKDGNLTSLGSQDITGAWGVTVNPNGNYLYVGSNSGNSINTLSITNGVLGAPVSTGSVNTGPRDFEFANAQANKFIYIPCFGNNKISIMNVSADGSSVTFNNTLNPGFNQPSFVKTHKNLNYIFASMTSGNRVRSYSYDNTGATTGISNRIVNNASISDIYYGTTHYIYIARPANNAIHYASTNQTTGALTLISSVNTNGTQPPYAVAVHPATWANYLYVTVKGTSNNVQLFKIDTGTGALTWDNNYATGTAPEKLAIVKREQ